VKILVLNAGSSSQKSCLYDLPGPLPEAPPLPVWEGRVEWNGNQAELRVAAAQGSTFHDHIRIESRGQATEQLLDALWTGKTLVVGAPSEVRVIGHRIVNGGAAYEEPTIITAEVKAAIAQMSAFAPLHNQAELEGIRSIEKRFGSVLQVAVFDTSFHRSLPASAAVYPGPYEWIARGIRRYGFHGINHQYCAERAAQMLGKDLQSLRLVTCHLGNGCSLAAIREGRSVDTTMGFTPLEGLMMGTRSGSVDPGILTYLMRQASLSGEQIDEVLNTKSGLLGISGLSQDMRRIVSAMQEGNARAKLAFDIFVHRLQSCIGSMIAALGGVDALVFTAGIGENSAEVRAAACRAFGFLGLSLDPERNLQPRADRDIAHAESKVRVLVIRAQEDWAIARQCWRLATAETRTLSGNG
jgi:acetate kinase